jgi:hypothetical protein
MSHFENTSEMYPGFGGQKTPEQLREMQQEREQKDAEKVAFLAEQKKIRDKEQRIEDDRAVLRQEEITSQRVIGMIMDANPNFDEYEAKRLYSEKVRELVAIRQFELAFFGQPSSAKSLLGVTRM